MKHTAIIKILLLMSLFCFVTGSGFADGNVKEILLRGLKAGEEGDLKAAELYFKQALAKDIFYIPARRAMDLINDYNQGLIDSEGAAMFLKGIEYNRTFQIEEAIDLFQKVVNNYPQYYMAHHNLGLAYHNDGRISKTIEHYDEALKLNPRYAYTHNNLGLVYMDTRQYYKAVKHYELAIRLNPDYYKAYNNLAVTLQRLKKKKESKAILVKAMDVNPNYTLAYGSILIKKPDDEQMKSIAGLSSQELLRLLETGTWRQRVLATHGLIAFNDASSVTSLIRLLRHRNSLIRCSVARILGKTGAVEAVDHLINLIAREREWTVRMEMVEALGFLKDPRSIHVLHRSLLEDPDYNIRVQAAWSLYRIRDPRSLEPLDKALRDRIADVRKAALITLANVYDKNGYYKRMLKKLEDNELIGFARPEDEQPEDLSRDNLNTLLMNGNWEQLMHLGEPAVDFLKQTIETGGANLRNEAVKGVGYIGGAKTFDILINLLQHKDDDIRFHAAAALAKAAAQPVLKKKAVTALIQLLDDKNWKVKGQAAASLRTVTGLNLGDHPQAWKNWLLENQ